MSAQIKLHLPTTSRQFLILLFFLVLVLGTFTARTDSVALASCCCPHGYIRGKDGKGCHYIKLITRPKPSLKPFILTIGTVAVLASALVNIWVYSNNNRRREIRAQFFGDNGGNLLLKEMKKHKSSSPHTPQIIIYSAEDVKSFTSNYSENHKIMQESCKEGTVIYRGTSSNTNDSNTTEFIILKIGKVRPNKIKHFVKQLLFVSQPHRSLVRLVGCCLETQFPFLVYDLHGDGSRTLLNRKFDRGFSCQMRLKAVADSARALNHLHSNKISGDKARVHGNVSSCNVLLDDSYDCKLFYAFDQYYEGNQSGDRCTNPIDDDVHGFGTVLKDVLASTTSFARHRSVEVEVYELTNRCMSDNRKERPTMKEVEARLSKLTMRNNTD